MIGRCSSALLLINASAVKETTAPSFRALTLGGGGSSARGSGCARRDGRAERRGHVKLWERQVRQVADAELQGLGFLVAPSSRIAAAGFESLARQATEMTTTISA